MRRLPKHHPSDALLLDYAAGSLDEGRSLLVATHIQFCPSCRRRLRMLEAMGGELLEALPPDPVSENLLDDTLERLDAPVEVPRPCGVASGFPAPLDGRVRALGGVRWRPVSPGIRQMELGGFGERGKVRLMGLAPGASVPHHAHHGTELTLVLCGGFSDRFGEYEPGDILEADAEDDHRPLADAREGCVCLLSTEAPLRFIDLLPRLAQAWTGI